MTDWPSEYILKKHQTWTHFTPKFLLHKVRYRTFILDDTRKTLKISLSFRGNHRLDILETKFPKFYKIFTCSLLVFHPACRGFLCYGQSYSWPAGGTGLSTSAVLSQPVGPTTRRCNQVSGIYYQMRGQMGGNGMGMGNQLRLNACMYVFGENSDIIKKRYRKRRKGLTKKKQRQGFDMLELGIGNGI